MARFLDRLVVSPLADGYTWYLDREFRYQTGPADDPRTLSVPKRFETDFASVPSLLTVVLPKWGVYGPAAVVHDWLYWEQAGRRAAADGVFLEAMRILRVGALKRTVLYLGVRWFGWWAWAENASLKRRGVTRMRPEDATWPALPTWRRLRLSPRAWLARWGAPPPS